MTRTAADVLRTRRSFIVMPRNSCRPMKPSIQDVADLVRGFTWERYSITTETRLEEDLRITGDDGVDLLEAAEERFGVDLSDSERGIAATLDLGPNEYLFHAEGSGLVDFVALFRRLRGKPRTTVRDLTVADLHEAILQAPPLSRNSAA